MELLFHKLSVPSTIASFAKPANPKQALAQELVSPQMALTEILVRSCIINTVSGAVTDNGHPIAPAKRRFPATDIDATKSLLHLSKNVPAAFRRHFFSRLASLLQNPESLYLIKRNGMACPDKPSSVTRPLVAEILLTIYTIVLQPLIH
jgi:hypothetical protein